MSTMQVVNNASGQQCKWSTMQVVNNASGQQCKWSTMQVVKHTVPYKDQHQLVHPNRIQ
jgi:hypothetical protein